MHVLVPLVMHAITCACPYEMWGIGICGMHKCELLIEPRQHWQPSKNPNESRSRDFIAPTQPKAGALATAPVNLE